MMMWLIATALAQTTYPDGPPLVATDVFRPSLDGGPYLGTESARAFRGTVASVTTAWGRQLLRLSLDGADEILVADALALHLGVRAGWKHVQIGLNAPAYPVVVTDRWRALLGDPTVDVKVSTHGDWGGVGALARVGTPLGGDEHQVGYPGMFGEIAAIGEWRVAALALTANVGYRAVPEQILADLVLDDVVWTRAGVSVAFDRWVAAAELSAEGQVIGSSEGRPVATEALASVQRHWSPGLVRLGIGRGLTNGVGTPSWRVVLGVAWLGTSKEAN